MVYDKLLSQVADLPRQPALLGQQRPAGEATYPGSNNYDIIAISEVCHATTLIRTIKNLESLLGIRYYTREEESEARNPIEQNELLYNVKQSRLLSTE